MANIDKYISDLLREYECVIVPNMGAFLRASFNSGIPSTQHLLVSPSAKISFNSSLNHNDGLLTNRVAQHEKLTYSEALHKIHVYVEEFHHEIDTGKKFVIEQVGSLYKNALGEIQFEPLSELADSTGNNEMQIAPLLNSEIKLVAELKKENPVVVVHSEKLLQKSIVNKKRDISKWSMMLLTGSILLFCVNVYFVFSYRLNFVQLKSFSLRTSKEKPVITHRSKLISEATVPSLPITPESILADASKSNAKKESLVSEANLLSGNEEAFTSEKNYFIVAGAFRSMGNAKRKLDELQSQGYKKAQIIDDNQRFHLVCYDRFHTTEEANENLMIRKSQDKNAWIFIR